MRRYIVVDALNMFFRATHTINPNSGVDTMIGLSFHVIFSSMRSAWKRNNADHIVFCLEGKSWRKQVYPAYKANRKVALLELSEKQREDHEIMLNAFNEFCKYIEDKTNVTVLQCPVAEADDLISFWVQSHPDDYHTIVSTDSDFQQLLSPNVEIYNGVDKTVTKLDGVYDEKGKKVIDKKTKLPKVVNEPEYTLFFKCIRGDKSDYIFSAYPGARETGTKNKVGIKEAYDDRHDKGFKWNNFMLQKWEDHEGVEHTVKSRYEFNRTLIDLTMQPDEVKIACASAIADAIAKPDVAQVGTHFMKFCGTWGLIKLSDNPTDFASMLNAKYIA